MSKKEPSASVLLVGGSDEFNRRRLISKIVATRVSEGWGVTPVDGSSPSPLDSVFSMTMMFGTPTLCVISNPEKLPPELISEQLSSPDPNISFLLVTDKDKLSGPVFDLVPKKNLKVFTLPPFYKLDEHASDFVVSEVQSKGNSIASSLAFSLVRKVGADKGVLSFEVQKVCMLAGPGAEITANHLRETLAALAESDGSVLLEALGTRNAKKLALEFIKYKASRGGDPTIELCGRVLTPALTRWIQAAHLSGIGMSSAAAAGAVGANPWYWENKILPFALQWGVAGCARMIRIVAQSQTLVFRGSVSPFSYLEASLLDLLKDT